MVTVKEIMHGATCVSSFLTVYEIAQLMARKNIGSVLINCDGETCGIVTERDLLSKVMAQGIDPQCTKACDVMAQLKFTIDENADIFEASAIFREHSIRRLPVTRSGKIIGMITTRDVAKTIPYALSSMVVRMHSRGENRQLDY